MRCPLCGGPVENEGPAGFVCETGHRSGSDEVVEHADHRLAQALWMAIEALHNEAAVLRVTAGGGGSHFADEADQQAQLLRVFARRHAARAEL